MAADAKQETNRCRRLVSCHMGKKQAKHQANLTGTDKAYYPPGSPLALNKRDKAVGDYERWQPINKIS